MNNDQTPSYLKPYTSSVAEHGGTFDATLWRSREGQRLRFQVFCNRVDFNKKSLLDVGCGIGDFAGFLIENQIAFDSFHGIDAMDEMILAAKERQLPSCTFETSDILTNTEALKGYAWITFSGTLNAMTQSQAMKVISDAFLAAHEGVAFNFLSDRCGKDPATEDLYPAIRFNTVEMLQLAFKLTTNVEFTQKYLGGHDATLILCK